MAARTEAQQKQQEARTKDQQEGKLKELAKQIYDHANSETVTKQIEDKEQAKAGEAKNQQENPEDQYNQLKDWFNEKHIDNRVNERQFMQFMETMRKNTDSIQPFGG